MAEIKALKDRLSQLEAKLAASQDKKESASGSNAPTYSPVTSLLDQIHVSGTLDSIYSYNLNSPTEKTNVARVFDKDTNSFTVNAAKLVVQKPASTDSPIGFRTDLFMGEDAKVIHSAGLGESSDIFDLEQAYAEANLGLSKVFTGMNDLNLKVGKFVTLAGAEVIESKDNFNTSRGLLFGYAVPFTHTGVRTTYTLDNGWDMVLGVNNGWDVSDDSNDSKTIESHLGFNNIALPGDSSLTVALQGYFGPEAANNNGNWRNLGDLVATYKTPWKPLTLVYNFDYASEEAAGINGGSADWYGHAGYAKIDLCDDWSIAFRGEYFNDSDGVRIVSGTPAIYTDYTGTLEYRPFSGLITRLELRYDHANQSVFHDSDSGSSKNQSTVSAELIYSY